MRRGLLTLIIGGGVVLVAIGVGLFMLLGRGGEQVNPEGEESRFGVLQPAEDDPSLGSANRLALTDADNDGLVNQDELIWGSDPDLADTDGDGYLDGEEVAAGYDPTIPSPNDKLSDLAQAAAVPAAALALADADQYLVDDADFKLAGMDFTVAFESEYSVADRSPVTMGQFSSSQPVQERLPRPDENELSEGVEDTRARISNYLAVADNDKALGDAALYSQAQLDLQVNSDATRMLALANGVRRYRLDLVETTVPNGALNIHKLLLGYTTATADTFEAIAEWPNDPVKSMVATRQLEVLDRKYYPIIQAEFERLRVLGDRL